MALAYRVPRKVPQIDLAAFAPVLYSVIPLVSCKNLESKEENHMTQTDETVEGSLGILWDPNTRSFFQDTRTSGMERSDPRRLLAIVSSKAT